MVLCVLHMKNGFGGKLFLHGQLQVRLGSLTLAKYTPKHAPKHPFIFVFLLREAQNIPRKRPRNRPAKHTLQTNFPLREHHFETQPYFFKSSPPSSTVYLQQRGLVWKVVKGPVPMTWSLLTLKFIRFQLVLSQVDYDLPRV